MSNDCCNPTPCVPGRLVDPLAMTPFPVAAFPAPGDDNRFAVLLGDDGNLYVSDGVDWNQVGGGTPPAGVPDFSALPAGAKYQSFRILVRNDGGVITHLFTTPFEPFFFSPFPNPGLLASKINNASSTATPTPIAPLASLVPAAGAMIPTDGLEPGSLLIDAGTFAEGQWTGNWELGHSNVPTLSKLLSATLNETVNGVAKLRLYLVAQRDNNDTEPLNLLTPGQFLTIDYSGFMI